MKTLLVTLLVVLTLCGAAVAGGKYGLENLKGQVATKSQQAQAKQSAEMKALLAML